MFPEFLLKSVEALAASAVTICLSFASIFTPTLFTFNQEFPPSSMYNGSAVLSATQVTPDTQIDNYSVNNSSPAPAALPTPPITPTETSPTVKCYTCPVELMPAENDYYATCPQPNCEPTCPPCRVTYFHNKPLMMCPMIACRALDDSSQL